MIQRLSYRWKQAEREKEVSWSQSHIRRNYKNGSDDPLCYAEIESARGTTQMDTKMGKSVWRDRVDTYTLITNEDSLCGTGNSR